jgi:type IV pilus assembly PilX-like protein
MSSKHRRFNETGSALLIVLTLTFLFSAIMIGAATVVTIETTVTSRYKDGVEALYIAEGGLAVVLAELRGLPDWTPILGGALSSSASQGMFTGSASIAGGTVFLCCGARSVFARLLNESASSAVPARRTLAWHPYLWSSWNGLAGQPGAGQFFLIALIQDDEEDGDRDEGTDLNGVVVVRSEAVRPDGLRRSIEALVAREAGDPGHGIPASVRVLRWGEVR